jgi:hypothetical protein
MTRAPHKLGFSVAVAAMVGLMVAVVTSAELAALARPSGYEVRIAAATQNAERLRRLLAGDPTTGPFGWDAICRQTPDREVQQLRKDIAVQADAAKLTVGGLEVGPDYQEALGDTLSPLRVRLEAQGPYQGAVSLLAVLAQSRPTLFVDSVDLTSRTSSVTLKLSGRVYCSAGT